MLAVAGTRERQVRRVAATLIRRPTARGLVLALPRSAALREAAGQERLAVLRTAEVTLRTLRSRRTWGARVAPASRQHAARVATGTAARRMRSRAERTTEKTTRTVQQR